MELKGREQNGISLKMGIFALGLKWKRSLVGAGICVYRNELTTQISDCCCAGDRVHAARAGSILPSDCCYKKQHLLLQSYLRPSTSYLLPMRETQSVGPSIELLRDYAAMLLHHSPDVAMARYPAVGEHHSWSVRGRDWLKWAMPRGSGLKRCRL